MIFHHLVTKIHTGRETQVEVRAQTQVGQHIHTKTRRMVGHISKPGLAIVGLETIVHNAYILEVGAYGEAKMHLLLVGILSIQNLVVVLRDGG